MQWVHLFSLIACGLLAAAPVVLAKSPGAKPMVDKLAQFGGIIGLVTLILGIINLIDIVPHIGDVFKHYFGIIGLAAVLCQLLLGFLLGFSLFAPFIFKPGTPAGAKGESIRQKIGGIQIPVGFVALIVAVLLVLIRLEILKP